MPPRAALCLRFLPIIAGIVAPRQLFGQAVLTGTVRQDSGGRPLPGVEVISEGTGVQAVTDRSGRYLLTDLPYGPQLVLFRLVGFRPIRQGVILLKGDTVRLDVVMAGEAAQELPPVEVVTPPEPRPMGLREGFEERRRMGFGKFIDLETLKANEHRRLSDLLRGIQGLRLVWYKPCAVPGGATCDPPELWASGTRMGRTCWMSVYLDGLPMFVSNSRDQFRFFGRRPPDFSREFQIHELAGVEVYRSAAELPGEFGGATSDCGVVVLWSRRSY